METATAASTEIQEEVTDELKAIIEKWRNEEGNLIMVFHEVQEHYGYVPRNIAMWVAQALDIPLARVYEVITFYNFFNLEPPATYTVAVCTGTACHLKGAGKLLDEFKKELNIKPNEQYTDDREFKVQDVRCIGCCGLAPAITINGEVHGKIKPEDVRGLIENCREQG